MTSVPVGYTAFRQDRTEIVALGSCADAVRRATAGQSLYAYAAAHPARRALRGRGVAYAVTLPDGETHVVVRHSRHGGLLAPVTGDRFLAPTRAPHELRTALKLAQAGVSTPEVVAYATYPAGAIFRRSDVATREVPGGRDLALCLDPAMPNAERAAALAATTELLRALDRAGAVHPDLNVKNVLIVAGDAGALRAFVLDVDRVTFTDSEQASVGAANVRRIIRSARKLRAAGRIAISNAELDALAAAATERRP
jgi:3-deoxy-D-manno-octulosonic acid kinase